MKTMLKRVLSLCLVFTLLFSAMPNVFAAEITDPAFVIGDATVTAGQTGVIVPLNVVNNSGFGGGKFDLQLPDGWTLTGIKLANSGVRSILYNRYDEDLMNYVSDYNPTPNVADKKLVIAAGTTNEDLTANGTIAWLQFNVPAADSVIDGEYEIKCVAQDLFHAYDDATDIKDQFTYVAGTITVTGGISRDALTPAVTIENNNTEGKVKYPATEAKPLEASYTVANKYIIFCYVFNSS